MDLLRPLQIKQRFPFALVLLIASAADAGRYSFLPRRVPSISKNKILLSIIDNYSYFGKNWQEGNVLTFKEEGSNIINRDLSKKIIFLKASFIAINLAK